MSVGSSQSGEMWFNGWVWKSASHSVTGLPLALTLPGRRRKLENDAFCHAKRGAGIFFDKLHGIKILWRKGGREGRREGATLAQQLQAAFGKVISLHFSFNRPPPLFGKKHNLTLRRIGEIVHFLVYFQLDDPICCYSSWKPKPTWTERNYEKKNNKVTSLEDETCKLYLMFA